MSDEKKIGVFLCQCGTNIANFVDLEKVEEWTKAREGVSFVETHSLLCSPQGKKFVEESVQKNNVDYVVVAACSPKMHEKTFQEAAGKSGINMARVHMANIREQCAWITKDKEEATEKSKKLINAALMRSRYHDKLEPKFMECLTDLIIIGGGIAGIEAALMAASAGRKVTIIEKDISLGGNVIKTEEVAPEMECAPCLLAPRLSDIKDNKNITVISNAEVTDVLGFFGNFTVKLKKKARYVNETCIGCEACFETCPVSVKSDFHLGLGERKAVYTAFPGSVPAFAVIDKENCLHFKDGSCNACVDSCPFKSIDFEDKDEEIELNAGGIVVATGFDSYDPSSFENLGYGKIDNVYTMPEFDRIASSNGPYMGEIKMKDGNPPKSIAVVHCAGSLCEGGLSYCSGICCMVAFKAGELLRKQVPDAAVFNIHDRLVFEGPKSEEFYHHQLKEGTKCLKTGDLSKVQVSQNNGKIKVSGEGFDDLDVDMVILATGMTPSKSSKAIAEKLNVDLETSGFFKTDHSTLHAAGASLDGIYLAGSAISPCGASLAITRAHAAAGSATSKLVPGKKIELEVMTAVINDELCGGCKLCISVCPYKAISYDQEKKSSAVNEAICRGCGTCAATCPSSAATAKHFTDEQIYAEIGGVIHE